MKWIIAFSIFLLCTVFPFGNSINAEMKTQNQWVLNKQMKDNPPMLKTNGYFGLSKKHILTIYNGNLEDQKAIHSFFQIDVKELESRLEHKLMEGIPLQANSYYEKGIQDMKKFALKIEK